MIWLALGTFVLWVLLVKLEDWLWRKADAHPKENHR